MRNAVCLSLLALSLTLGVWAQGIPPKAELPFHLSSDSMDQTICAPADFDVPLQVTADVGFSGTIDLVVVNTIPGSTAMVEPVTITPPGSATLHVTTPDPFAAGEYYGISVQGWYGAEGPDTLVLHMIVQNDPPTEAPVLTTPPNGEPNAGYASVDLTWDYTPSATGYHVQVSEDSGFSTFLLDTTLMGVTTAYLPSLTPDATYWWRVAAINACGEGAFCAPFSFVAHQPETCVDSQVKDGGFENGVPSGAWTEESINFGTPIANDSGRAHSGDWLCWFRGSPVVDEIAAVTQDVLLPVGRAATLSFYLEIPSADKSAFIRVFMDADQLFEVTGENAAPYSNYQLVTVDLSNYADGISHTLGFSSQISAGSDPTDIYVDDICLTSAAGEGEGEGETPPLLQCPASSLFSQLVNDGSGGFVAVQRSRIPQAFPLSRITPCLHAVSIR